MRILILNQAFHPDVVSSGQHLSDLAAELAARGHEVTVLVSRRGYDDPGKVFPKRESWRGVQIFRVFTTGLGKTARWRRAADFASFLASCCWNLLWIRKPDLVVAMTSPPLVAYIGAWYARMRRCRFCYWIMDLNPDEAVAAGWLDPKSSAARLLESFSRFSLRHASKVVVLDRFMQKRIADKQIAEKSIEVIPPWSHDAEVRFDAAGRERFRKLHGLENKFVVMYSGNHSPCHPLDTVLHAAEKLAGDQDVVFLFVGGGSQFAKVKECARSRSLANVRCLPYQPMDQLSGSLSAADAHLVVMGDPFVGLVHPCKIYNILRVGAPLLYIGPQPSHVSEILQQLNGQMPGASARHGEVDRVVQSILELKKAQNRRSDGNLRAFAGQYSREVLLPQLISALESAAQHK